MLKVDSGVFEAERLRLSTWLVDSGFMIQGLACTVLAPWIAMDSIVLLLSASLWTVTLIFKKRNAKKPLKYIGNILYILKGLNLISGGGDCSL